MEEVFLVLPTESHKEAWEYIIAEFDNANEKIVPYALKMECNHYDEFLKITDAIASGNFLPTHTNLVQATTYFLMEKERDKILGAVNIRHELNAYLMNIGGHIGYGVAPSERRKGYASAMLALALEKCRQLDINKALITCDKHNIASAKTILKNGGILENEYIEENNNIVQRYWIDIC